MKDPGSEGGWSPSIQPLRTAFLNAQEARKGPRDAYIVRPEVPPATKLPLLAEEKSEVEDQIKPVSDDTNLDDEFCGHQVANANAAGNPIAAQQWQDAWNQQKVKDNATLRSLQDRLKAINDSIAANTLAAGHS